MKLKNPLPIHVAHTVRAALDEVEHALDCNGFDKAPEETEMAYATLSAVTAARDRLREVVLAHDAALLEPKP